jgi:hypothetical protein
MTTPSQSLILAVVLLSSGCASAPFGTLESVLKGDRLATGSELQEVRVERAGASPATTRYARPRQPRRRLRADPGAGH